MSNGFNLESVGDHPTLFTAKDEGIVFAAGDKVANRFEVVAPIGGGGMGIVYQVRDLVMAGRVKALKVILPSLMKSERAQERFMQEAEIAQQLAHPNIVNTFDLGEHGGIRFLTMEFLEGRSLAAALAARKQLPLEQVVRIIDQLLSALTYAHRNTVHRDIKPQNVFICKDGAVKLLDFGLARVVGSARFTQSSAAVGTAAYMAPEQLQGQEATARSDLYSLGAVAYQCLTGRLPMGVFQMPTRLDPMLPPWVDPWISSLLNADPNQRPATAVEAQAALRQFARSGAPPPAAPPPRVPQEPVSPPEAERPARIDAVALCANAAFISAAAALVVSLVKSVSWYGLIPAVLAFLLAVLALILSERTHKGRWLSLSALLFAVLAIVWVPVFTLGGWGDNLRLRTAEPPAPSGSTSPPKSEFPKPKTEEPPPSSESAAKTPPGEAIPKLDEELRNRIADLRKLVNTGPLDTIRTGILEVRAMADKIADTRVAQEFHQQIDPIIIDAWDAECAKKATEAEKYFKRGGFDHATAVCGEALKMFQGGGMPQLRTRELPELQSLARIQAVLQSIAIQTDPSKRFIVLGFMSGGQLPGAFINDTIKDTPEVSTPVREGDHLDDYLVVKVNSRNREVILRRGGETFRLYKR